MPKPGAWFESLAFAPLPGPPEVTPADFGWRNWRDVYFPSRDGTELHGWLIIGAHRGPPKGLVVHAHGNAGNVGAQFIPAVETCLSSGWDVLMFDYRGFGLSRPGPLTRLTVVDDLAGALTLGCTTTPGKPLALLGHSMGGATAALAVAERQIRDRIHGLCLIAAFADWNQIFADVLKTNPLTRLLVFPVAYCFVPPWRREPAEGLALWPAEKPLLLVHGEADTIVPIHHLDLFLEALPAEVRSKAALLRLPQVGHNDIGASPELGQEALREAICNWLDRTAAASGAGGS